MYNIVMCVHFRECGPCGIPYVIGMDLGLQIQWPLLHGLPDTLFIQTNSPEHKLAQQTSSRYGNSYFRLPDSKYYVV